MTRTKRPHIIQVRYSDEELAHLDAQCSRDGMTRSEWLRSAGGGVAIGEHRVGKVERTGDGRQQDGIAVVIRPEPKPHLVPVRPRRGGYDTRNDKCPQCGALTYSTKPGKRGCSSRSCSWEGPV